ncbi:MAG: UDP-2,3-diacylglucosamine diphosphatase, partial [Gammaproteobacteria bacterium]
DVNQAEVSRVMKKFNVNQLIHGHTHRPAIHQHDTGSRIVLGDWEDEISYLQCDQQQCQLIDYRVTRN